MLKEKLHGVGGQCIEDIRHESHIFFYNRKLHFLCNSSDDHWQPMCTNAVSQRAWDDSLLGEEECRSPFGTYELVIPVDDQLSCKDPGIRNRTAGTWTYVKH